MTSHTQNATIESASEPKVKPYWTVSRAASKLHVSREHLSRVLHGKRVSASLLRMYQALTGAPAPATTASAGPPACVECGPGRSLAVDDCPEDKCPHKLSNAA